MGMGPNDIPAERYWGYVPREGTKKELQDFKRRQFKERIEKNTEFEFEEYSQQERIRMSDILERPPVQDDLFVFVRFGLEVVKEIVEAEEGALKKVDPNGLTCLHYCADLDQIEVAEYLIAHGADSATPLYMAMTQGNYEFIEFLAKNNADFNKCPRDSQTSAAIMAQQWGKNRLAKHLVKLGADPSQEDEFGNTMAYYLTDNSEDLLEYLITKGLDINHLNKDNKTPIDYYILNSNGPGYNSLCSQKGVLNSFDAMRQKGLLGEEDTGKSFAESLAEMLPSMLGELNFEKIAEDATRIDSDDEMEIATITGKLEREEARRSIKRRKAKVKETSMGEEFMSIMRVLPEMVGRPTEELSNDPKYIALLEAKSKLSSEVAGILEHLAPGFLQSLP